ncbi:MAG TPA: hypothetical protein VND19_20905 [Acetobacteraceae bacterium]|nr:hypothetical protein [Acetobacteraceae bacterium]
MPDELPREARDGVGYITFNRPQAGSALTFAMHARPAEIAAEPGEARVLAHDEPYCW